MWWSAHWISLAGRHCLCSLRMSAAAAAACLPPAPMQQQTEGQIGGPTAPRARSNTPRRPLPHPIRVPSTQFAPPQPWPHAIALTYPHQGSPTPCAAVGPPPSHKTTAADSRAPPRRPGRPQGTASCCWEGLPADARVGSMTGGPEWQPLAPSSLLPPLPL